MFGTKAPSHLSLSRSRSDSESLSASHAARLTGDAQVTATVMMWFPSNRNTSSALAKTPILRDVPQMKQKLSKRASASPKVDFTPTTPWYDKPSSAFRSSGSSWLKEKPSKNKLHSLITTGSLPSPWKKVIILFRENGILTILNQDHALLYSIQCSHLSATDIRAVHDSLFARPNVLGIFSRPSNFSSASPVCDSSNSGNGDACSIPPSPVPASINPSVAAISSPSKATNANANANAKSDPIYIEFPSDAKLQYWKALLRIYAQPEIYGPPGSAGSHRCFRQIDLIIYDAKHIIPKFAQHYDAKNMIPKFPSSQPSSSSFTQSIPSLRPSHSGPDLANAQNSSSVVEPSIDLEKEQEQEKEKEDVLSRSSAGPQHDKQVHRINPLAAGFSLPSLPDSDSPKPIKKTAALRRVSIADVEDDSGRSSRAGSTNDAASLTGDDNSSMGEHNSGPISGLSGSGRFTLDSTPKSLPGPFQGSTSFPKVNDKKNLCELAPFDRYCRVVLNGEVVARTNPRPTGATDNFNVEKFRFTDLSEIHSLTIEVLHATQKTSSSISTPSGIPQKFVLLGVVEVPIDSLRRGEEVQGRYPIWSTASLNPTTGTDLDAKHPNSFHKGMVGELNMSICLRQDTVLPQHTYDEIDRRLHAEDAIQLIHHLTKNLNEDAIISHLTNIYAASGTITERIAALTNVESQSWGEKLEPELLFRANTLLSRSVDHFQRLLALTWLDNCIGHMVRLVCYDPRPWQSRFDTPSSPFLNGDPSDLSFTSKSPLLGFNSPFQSSHDSPMTVETLRKLSQMLWESIYLHRHECPADLRRVLSHIRNKVNARYPTSKSGRPGIQGVGAFIFLRLFCAALNAPQLYGLTASQPSRTCQRRLLLLSKMLLALANKKSSFDKDKDRDLLPLNDFLQTYASAFDDYIAVVSTEPPNLSKPTLLGTTYDDDQDLQALVRKRIVMLPSLHKESIPCAPYMVDRPLAYASFISYIVMAAEEKDQETVSIDGKSQPAAAAAAASANNEFDPVTGELVGLGILQQRRSEMDRKVDEFIELCCEVEDVAGYHIERAGYDPQPIPTTAYMAGFLRQGEINAIGSYVSTVKSCQNTTTSPLPLPDVTFSDALPSSSSSFNTITGRGGSVGDVSPASSPSTSRSRRATVSASGYRSPFKEQPAEFLSGPHDSIWNGFATSATTIRPQDRQKWTLPMDPQDETSSRQRCRRQNSLPPSPSFKQVETGTFASASRAKGETERGSEDELGQAYRRLRIEKRRKSSLSQTSQDLRLVASSSFLPATFSSSTTPLRELGRMHVLLETEDGSTFEPVNLTPPPVSRSARQSIELSQNHLTRPSVGSTNSSSMSTSVEASGTSVSSIFEPSQSPVLSSSSSFGPAASTTCHFSSKRLASRSSFVVAKPTTTTTFQQQQPTLSLSTRRHSSDFVKWSKKTSNSLFNNTIDINHQPLSTNDSIFSSSSYNVTNASAIKTDNDQVATTIHPLFSIEISPKTCIKPLDQTPNESFNVPPIPHPSSSTTNQVTPPTLLVDQVVPPFRKDDEKKKRWWNRL